MIDWYEAEYEINAEVEVLEAEIDHLRSIPDFVGGPSYHAHQHGSDNYQELIHLAEDEDAESIYDLSEVSWMIGSGSDTDASDDEENEEAEAAYVEYRRAKNKFRRFTPKGYRKRVSQSQ